MWPGPGRGNESRPGTENGGLTRVDRGLTITLTGDRIIIPVPAGYRGRGPVP